MTNNYTKKPIVVWRGGAPVSYYEAGKNNPLYKRRVETGDGDSAVIRAGKSLRNIARHLDQNHDISRGILNILVQNTVGHQGITVEPQPRDSTGKIHRPAARSIRVAFEKWRQNPEATGQHDWPSAARLLARSYFRDGEAFGQHLIGRIPGLVHGMEGIRYSVELIEADMLPLDLNDEQKRITAGVERSLWNRPIKYHFLRKHPGSQGATSLDTRPVDASLIFHPKIIDRIGQARGVSIFSSVLLRLDDLKDYEESERIAAKVAASMAGYIKKGVPDDYNPSNIELDADGNELARDLKFQAGMIFDDLRPGEDIGTIDTGRPNPNLLNYRNSNLKAVAAGTNVSFSSASKSYDGTYSSQRQELVEQTGGYQIISADLINAVDRPVYEKFVDAAIAGSVKLELSGVDPLTLYDALYIPPAMPWIDPRKEMEADIMSENAVYESAQSIIRRRGRNPSDVLEQEAAWRELLIEKGLNSAGAEGVEIEADNDNDEDETNELVRKDGRN